MPAESHRTAFRITGEAAFHIWNASAMFLTIWAKFCRLRFRPAINSFRCLWGSFGLRSFLVQPPNPSAAAPAPGGAFDNSSHGELLVSFAPDAKGFVKEDDS